MAKLKPTEKQKQFVDAYLADPEMNATRAYLSVYTSVKNERVAAANASRLFSKPHAQEYLRQRMKAREKRTEITQDKVIQELAKIGFENIKDFAAFRTEKTVVGYQDDGEPIIGYKPIIDIKPSDEVDGAAIQQVSLTDKGTLSFKLQDKVKALELIGRHLGMWNDKLDLTGRVDAVIEITGIDEDEAEN